MSIVMVLQEFKFTSEQKRVITSFLTHFAIQGDMLTPVELIKTLASPRFYILGIDNALHNIVLYFEGPRNNCVIRVGDYNDNQPSIEILSWIVN